MWMFLFPFLFQAGPNPCQNSPAQTQSPSLIVQVVDPGWLPISEAEVTLKPVRGDAKAKPDRKETDKDGYAKFFAAGDADYDIDCRNVHFQARRSASRTSHQALRFTPYRVCAAQDVSFGARYNGLLEFY
jgi:hypothetical protein